MEEYLKILESEISNFIIHKGKFDLKFTFCYWYMLNVCFVEQGPSYHSYIIGSIGLKFF